MRICATIGMLACEQGRPEVTLLATILAPLSEKIFQKMNAIEAFFGADFI